MGKITYISLTTMILVDFSFHHRSISDQKGLTDLHEKYIMFNSVHNIAFITHIRIYYGYATSHFLQGRNLWIMRYCKACNWVSLVQ